MTPPRVPPESDRTARLLGLTAMDALARAHVVVLGMGGVGTFAAEALARAGVGRLTLVDGERVDPTNANRQLHALQGVHGTNKAEAMAARLRLVNPLLRVDAVPEFYGEDNAERLVPAGVSAVIDAMDTVVAKLHVIARCRERGLSARHGPGRRLPARSHRRPGDATCASPTPTSWPRTSASTCGAGTGSPPPSRPA